MRWALPWMLSVLNSAALAQWSGEAPMPGMGGDIQLTDQRGKPFALRAQPAQPTLLFFGFTQCAQVCPPALAQMQALASRMKTRQPPRMLFVTLDPRSDTPAALQQYLGQFDARIVGLTGTMTQVDEVARRFGVGMQTREGALEHSARLYLLDADHRLARVYKLNVPLDQLAKDIQALQAHVVSLHQP